MTRPNTTKTGPNPRDIHAGQVLRRERVARGISQEMLAAELDLSFQQVQKYERGTNRMSISRAGEIAEILGISPLAFFEDSDAPLTDDRNIMEMMRLYNGLADDRRTIVRDVCRTLAR